MVEHCKTNSLALPLPRFDLKMAAQNHDQGQANYFKTFKYPLSCLNEKFLFENTSYLF